MKFKTTQVLKMGNKVGIFIGNSYAIRYKIKKGSPVLLFVIYKGKKLIQICRMNSIIVLRKSVLPSLNYGDSIRFSIQNFKNLKRNKKIFCKGQIDLTSLIPLKTVNGYELLTSQFSTCGEKWLRIWYSHKKGSGRQFEVKRYIDIDKFASLLGQYQAEGTKKGTSVEFTNILMTEHKDFIKSLEHMGVTNIKLLKMKNAYRTVVRYSALASIILYSMNTMRKMLIKNEMDYNLYVFANTFFSKVLIGDGTIDIGKRKVPQVSIRIVDCNKTHLQDYKKLMKRLGFHPHINEKYITVKSSCSLENLIYLYNIKAFWNSNNWNKLLIAIRMLLEGRRLNTLYRFLDLRSKEYFTSLDINKSYNVGLRTANHWIGNCIKAGYVKKSSNKSKPIEYMLTQKAIDLASTLEKIENEYVKIKALAN